MAETIVTELKKAGIPARRISPGEPLPRQGWIIREDFVQVEEGDRLRRAAIGFGSGAAEVSLNVVANDLSRVEAQPLLEFDAATQPGRMPGAVVMMNPYVAAAKFVLGKNELTQDGQKAAAAIADKMERALSQPGPVRQEEVP